MRARGLKFPEEFEAAYSPALPRGRCFEICQREGDLDFGVGEFSITVLFDVARVYLAALPGAG